MKRPSTRSILIGLMAFVAGITAARFLFRVPMQKLNEGALTAARRQWDAADVLDYDVRYELNNDSYEVHVRDGIVVEVLTNGTRPVSTNWSTYSIDGLLDLLALELDNLMNPHGPFGDQVNAVLAKVRFDDAFGYPAYYLRSGGGARPATVRIVAFSLEHP